MRRANVEFCIVTRVVIIPALDLESDFQLFVVFYPDSDPIKRGIVTPIQSLGVIEGPSCVIGLLGR